MKMKLYAMMVIAMIAALQTQATLLLEYDFNEAGGSTTLTDASGNGYTGSVTDGSTSGKIGADYSGLTGSSYGNDKAFDNTASSGHSDLAYTGRAATPVGDSFYNLTLKSHTAVTLEFWFKTSTTLNTSTRLISGRGFEVYGNGSQTLKIDVKGVEGTTSLSAGGFDDTSNVWQFYAISFDSTRSGAVGDEELKVYKSGASTDALTLVGSVNGLAATLSTGESATRPIEIGNIRVTPNRSFDGFMDNVRIYNTGKTLEEIQATVNADLVPEPGSVLMVMVGAGVLFIVRRIRARA
jgi:hypothetical protein